MTKFSFLLCFLLGSCLSKGNQVPTINIQSTTSKIDVCQAESIGSIPLPSGYKRITVSQDSYSNFLRKLTLKKDNHVYLYNGELKKNQSVQFAVINLDVGNKDLQQCADAVIRLRAEFLFQQQKTNEISFRLTNGFLCYFNHYAQGYRIQIKGTQCYWVKKERANDSYATFRQYLDLVYAYAGTKSLSQQLTTIPFSKIHPGAVLLQTGVPYGHAVTVMDMAYHPSTHDTIFLLSQSYMPAQSIHILRNPGDKKLSPWYSTQIGDQLETPEWTFTKDNLKQF